MTDKKKEDEKKVNPVSWHFSGGTPRADGEQATLNINANFTGDWDFIRDARNTLEAMLVAITPQVKL